jgi:hypothetical protein
MRMKAIVGWFMVICDTSVAGLTTSHKISGYTRRTKMESGNSSTPSGNGLFPACCCLVWRDVVAMHILPWRYDWPKDIGVLKAFTALQAADNLLTQDMDNREGRMWCDWRTSASGEWAACLLSLLLGGDHANKTISVTFTKAVLFFREVKITSLFPTKYRGSVAIKPASYSKSLEFVSARKLNILTVLTFHFGMLMLMQMAMTLSLEVLSNSPAGSILPCVDT